MIHTPAVRGRGPRVPSAAATPLLRTVTLLLCAGALAAAAVAQDRPAAPSAPAAATTAAPAATPPAAPAPRVDARTEDVLRRMSDLLAKTPRFALEAEEQFDEVSDNAPRVQLTNVRRLAVQRPDRLAADATGDTLNRASVYDGRTLSVVDKDRNAYFTVEAPATIDATLDAVAEKLGVIVPLSDLAYSDPYAVLMEGVAYGEYRGIHQVGGVPCHHLAFAQDAIEWQLWVDAGEQPLPRKLLIAYVDEPGVPQYAATFTRWTLKPAFGDELFRFEPPEDATRLAVEEFARPASPGSATAAPPGSAAVTDAPSKPAEPKSKAGTTKKEDQR